MPERIYQKLRKKVEEKAADPWKEDTGLFFFRGEPGGKVAFCNAGGGFAYVGAMQDSFPHALELSKKGYNARVDRQCRGILGTSDGMNRHKPEMVWLRF